MNYIRRISVLAAICGLSLVGCEDEADLPAHVQAGGQAAAAPAPAPAPSLSGARPSGHDDPGRVSLPAEGFSFVPPTGWSPMTKIPPAFVAYGQPPENGFRVNMNVNSNPDPGMPIDALPPELKAALPKMFNGWRWAEDGFVDINGRRTYRIVSEYQLNQTPLKLATYILIGGNKKLYTLSFTAPADRFEQNKAAFDQCAGSVLVD